MTIRVAVLCLLAGIAGAAFAQEADECRQIGARELIRALNQAAVAAVEHCPEAPACPACPSVGVAGQYVLCTQRWDGRVVRCKRIALKDVPLVTP